MRGPLEPRAFMHIARDALIRCETLDLFGSRAAAPQPPSPEPGPAEAEPAWQGLLFRIGPDDQLDLFLHSPAQRAAADARRALKAGDIVAAREHLAALRLKPDFERFVADCEHCIELIACQDPRWADPAQAVPWLEATLLPAAERCLQADAALISRPAWQSLLQNSPQRRFDPGCRHAHPAYLWQALGDPAQAVIALEQDPAWRQQEAALLWHAELCEQAQLAERLHADLLELCLSWPDAAESWLSTSPNWARRWAAWCELDDALPIQAFPAWCRLSRAVEFPLPPDSDPRPGAQWLRSADRLARDSHNLALRKALHTQCPALLANWLADRTA